MTERPINSDNVRRWIDQDRWLLPQEKREAKADYSHLVSKLSIDTIRVGEANALDRVRLRGGFGSGVIEDEILANRALSGTSNILAQPANPLAPPPNPFGG